MTAADECPCGSGRAFDACCGAIHGGRPAQTAEALMRARYSAFARGRPEFLLATGTKGDADSVRASMAGTEWLRLVVHQAERGGPDDDRGSVSFSAWFLEDGAHGVLHEVSRFGRVDGAWRYLDGDTRLEALDLGRNDACPCGSGQKVKRCHRG